MRNRRLLACWKGEGIEPINQLSKPAGIFSIIVKDQAWKVKCGACNETFTLPADQYVAAVENRSAESAGIVCERCGESAAWRADRPIEYSDEQWKAGWVGRDVLISDLKAYHKAHPEGEPVAATSEQEGI